MVVVPTARGVIMPFSTLAILLSAELQYIVPSPVDVALNSAAPSSSTKDAPSAPMVLPLASLTVIDASLRVNATVALPEAWPSEFCARPLIVTTLLSSLSASASQVTSNALAYLALSVVGTVPSIV